jgi:uncharacterized membrane protein
VWSEAFGVSESLEIVGHSDGPTAHLEAVRWDDGGMIELDLPIGPSSTASDLNETYQIVGWMGVDPSPLFTSEAFLWDNGITTSLGMPKGGTFSAARAISNNGVICGHYGYPTPNPFGGDYTRHALAWINGQMIDLGTLPGFIGSMAFDVNDDAAIVGYCYNDFPSESAAFIWRDGVMTALDDLLAPEFAEYEVQHARGINSSGQIAATVRPPTTSNRAALLTPIPPLPGDTNCDWLVNIDDLLAVIGAWGPFEGEGGPGSPDLIADGSVDIDDLLLVLSHWG